MYTRKIQNLKVNHRSKNGVTIAEDTDIALLNADKNSKTIKINHKVQRTKQIILPIHEKDQNLPIKTFTVIIVLEKQFQTIQIIQEINQLITLTSEEDYQTKEIHVISHKKRYSRSNSQNNYSQSNSNRPEYSVDTSSHSNSWNRHYSKDRSRNSSHNRNRNYSNNRNRSYSNNRNQRYQNNISRD